MKLYKGKYYRILGLYHRQIDASRKTGFQIVWFNVNGYSVPEESTWACITGWSKQISIFGDGFFVKHGQS